MSYNPDGGGPLPLSAFLDAASAPDIVDVIDVADAPQTTTVSPPLANSCLLTPEFLGCHLIASLGEELLLDDGRLRIWCGAALHNDQAAAVIEAQARARRNGAIDERAETLFSTTSASGSRLIGAPYLRAAVGEAPPLHAWLAPSVAESLQGLGERDALGGEAGTDAERVMHQIGPYRLRVLSAEVIAGAAAGVEGGLHQAETLAVHVAVDKLSLVEVSSRARDGADPALAALTTEGGASIDIGAAGYTGPLQPAGDGAKAKRTRARKKEAKELGDAIERMLGL